jgi:uncharacterized membrane protein YuzA (DUF378 family)
MIVEDLVNILRENSIFALSIFVVIGVAGVFFCYRLLPRDNACSLADCQPNKDRVLLIQSMIFILIGAIVLFREPEDIVGWVIGFAGIVSLLYFLFRSRVEKDWTKKGP